MKKSIIAVALAVVAMATLMTACKKNEDFKEKPNTDNKVEYSTDENGDLFITNVDGEKIPVTTERTAMRRCTKSLEQRLPHRWQRTRKGKMLRPHLLPSLKQPQKRQRIRQRRLLSEMTT